MLHSSFLCDPLQSLVNLGVFVYAVFSEYMALVVMNIYLQAVPFAFLAICGPEYVVAIQRLKIGVHSAYKAMCLVFLYDAFSHFLHPILSITDFLSIAFEV
jgi:hypothetical protein